MALRKPRVSHASGIDRSDLSRAMNAVVCGAAAPGAIGQVLRALCVGHASRERASADIVQYRSGFIGGFLTRFRGLKEHEKPSLKAADERAPPGFSRFAQFCALAHIIHTNTPMRIDKTTAIVI
ncbi:hypothetical protein [Paraburkholderia tropica]|uniref:hypothetical protein n=1 Tax=Paraburkholderia tropica TaxID=92647 RepID=UPI001CC56AB4|nr:hypothetical protein [Paraburkholderia tropica]